VSVSRRSIALTAIVFVVFGTGPTVGDVGACGKTATELDEASFRHGRKVVDCRRCTACDLATPRCARACDEKDPGDVAFPSTCRPVFHDGEACLRALLAASCSDYARYVDDAAPEVPSECAFCREAAP
jgi:hypothetical protein